IEPCDLPSFFPVRDRATKQPLLAQFAAARAWLLRRPRTRRIAWAGFVASRNKTRPTKCGPMKTRGRRYAGCGEQGWRWALGRRFRVGIYAVLGGGAHAWRGPQPRLGPIAAGGRPRRRDPGSGGRAAGAPRCR